MARVEAHEHALTRMMLEGISSIEGITVLGPDTDVDRIGVVAFAVDGVHPHDVGQFMDSVDVAVRVGHHCAIRCTPSSRCVPRRAHRWHRRRRLRKLSVWWMACRRCELSSVGRIGASRRIL